MRPYLVYATWAFLAGVGIPLIGVLNASVARSVGNPFAASAVMFAVALLLAAAITVPLYGVPTLAQLLGAPLTGYAAGVLIAFYALSATVIIPRFGAASFVAFILIAQLAASAIVDQFGLFGIPRRPVDTLRLAGLAVIVAGIAIMEISNLRRR
jgi:bacterial/archaeal transporter family-2 protein